MMRMVHSLGSILLRLGVNFVGAHSLRATASFAAPSARASSATRLVQNNTPSNIIRLKTIIMETISPCNRQTLGQIVHIESG